MNFKHRLSLLLTRSQGIQQAGSLLLSHLFILVNITVKLNFNQLMQDKTTTLLRWLTEVLKQQNSSSNITCI